MDLLTLFGGALGGALRFVPEVFKYFSDKDDRKHELAMTSLQLQIDKARSEQAIDLVHANTQSAQITGEMQAYLEAVKGQAQLTGVKWVDAVNSTVRPFITYWWMILLSIYKITTIYVAWINKTGLQDFASKVWTAEDAGILSLIIGFWFVDRAIKKMK